MQNTIALPDPGSVSYVNPVTAGAVPAGEAGQATTGSRIRSSSTSYTAGMAENAGQGLLQFPRSMSNALLVSAADSASGHPLAVMGPQVSYFSPEILMEEDIHGPGIDAEGAAFPGVNLYVELGHGPDYAWSATSAGQNIIDTFAAPLCNPSGGTVSIDSDYYVLNGQCVQMETLTRTESWQPNLGDSTPAGSVTFQTKRTAYGIVIARARVKGRPVVYTNLRSTYMHELDSALGFEMFNEPAIMQNPQDFMNAAYNIGYTFNWFYADDKNIAYFNSGLNPVRAANTDPLFPSWASDAWQGMHPAAQMTPASVTEDQTPRERAPAGGQPALSDELEQQAGPGLQRRRHRPGVLVDLPLSAARQQHQRPARRERRQDDAGGPDQRDGDRRDPGPARRRGAAVRAADHRPPKRPDARHRGQRAAGVGGERRAPDQPGAPGRLRRLRPDRRGADHGRLVAAARRAPSSAPRWARIC